MRKIASLVIAAALLLSVAAHASASNLIVATHHDYGEDTYELRLVAVDPSGGAPRVLRHCAGENCGTFTNVSVSPDGRRIAVGGYGPSFLIGRTDGSSWRRVELPSFWWVRTPVWSPNGERLAFVGVLPPRNGWIRHDGDIYTIGTDGTGLTRLTRGAYADVVDWSRRGRLAFYSNDLTDAFLPGHTSFRGAIVTMNSRGRSRRLAAEGLTVNNPRWSHRGEWLHYETWRSGQVALRRVNGFGRRRGPFLDRVHHPVWSPDGRRVVLRRPISIGTAEIVEARSNGRSLRRLELDLPASWGQPLVLAWAP